MENNGTFHDSATGVNKPCVLVIESQSLLIYHSAPKEPLHIWRIKKLKSCVYNDGLLVLTNAQHPSQSVICSGEVAKAVYAQWIAEELPATGGNPLFVIRLMFWSGFILVSLALWVYFYVLPYAADKAVRLMPTKTEIELGDTMADKILLSSSQNDSATTYANRLIAGFRFQSPYPIKVHVIQSTELNAFAIPGGHIFVYSALIKRMSHLEQWVALIGHEQAHIKNQHALKSISRQAAASLLVASLFGDISGISTGLLSQAQSFEQLKYSRELETEADDEGLRFMALNAYNPAGMVQLLQLLKAENSAEPGIMRYLSTHPDTESRLLNVKSQLNANTKFREPSDTLKKYFARLKYCLK